MTARAPAARALARPWLGPLLLGLAAALVYTIHLDRLPEADELYHILAAQGLLRTGVPQIAEGVYDRVLLHTYLVAGSFLVFGQSLWAARIPSLVFTALADVVLFLWLRRRAGPAAAWLGAGLFAFSPFAIGIAQFCRFYALQTLCFTAGCTAADSAILSPGSGRRRALRGAAAAALFILAIYLQPTTLLGLAGLGAWVVGAFAWPWLRDPAVPTRKKLLTAAAALVLAAIVAAATGGILAELWQRYRFTPLFQAHKAGEFWWYHGWLNLLYPSLWPLVGLIGLAGLALWPRPMSLALTVFGIGFLLNSFAAAKALRYMAYAQPFLFAIWGLGLVALWPRLRDLSTSLGCDLARCTGAVWPARLLLGGAVLFALLANPFWLRSASLLAEITIPPEVPLPDWRNARPYLAPALAKADVVVTTEELGTLYFLGRFDVALSPSKIGEAIDARPGAALPDERSGPFVTDPRTGRAVIGSEAALARLMACYPRGLIVGLKDDWGKPWKVSPAMGAFIEAETTPIPLPPRLAIFAYRWDHPIPAGAAGPDCGPLAGLTRHPPVPAP